MKAVIMAGGEGSRLRPLTCDIPKPMAPICGRPVISRIVNLLIKNGFDSAVVTLGYLPNVITDYFAAQPPEGIELTFVKEEKPLGTAGGVLNALSDADEDVLVISGDAVCDFDLGKIWEFHKSKGADATIVTVTAEDPREYGLVNFDRDGRVTGFVEKPSWPQALTDNANTGIYVLSPQVLKLITAGVPQDFASDIFPAMLSSGMSLFAYPAEGYWCDIGDLNSYLSCQLDVINGNVKLDVGCPSDGGIYHTEHLPLGDCKIFPPVYLGERVHIGEGAVIGPNAVIGDGVNVGARSRVRNSVMMKNSMTGERASLTGAIVCQSASVKSGATLFEGAVIGSSAVIGEEAQVMPGVCVWPGKTVEDSAIADRHIKLGSNTAEVFDDEGISGTAGVEMTPDFCALIGAAIGSVKGVTRCGAGFGNGAAASALGAALISGMQSTGAAVWNFGKLPEPAAVCASAHCDLPVSAYVTGGSKCTVRIYVGGGLPSDRRTEREIASRLTHRDFSRCGWEEFREPVTLDCTGKIYREAVCAFAPDGLEGTGASVSCADGELEGLLTSVLSSLGCRKDPSVRFQLSASGTSVSVFGDKTGYVAPRKILALLCKLEFEEGRDVYLPANAPLFLDEIAARYYRKIYRGSKPTRENSTKLLFGDGIMQTVRILSAVRKRGEDIVSLLNDIPDVSFITRKIDLSVSPGRVMEQMNSEGEFTGEGIRITREGAAIVLTPSKKGKSISLIAEASNSETAMELCGEIERKIAAITLDTGRNK
ncbi:MAG: NTP transferase domain-containing protein [Clostridia bacterium]|nr:NTP transferase domain-containing protein [Clostridia bacterium]